MGRSRPKFPDRCQPLTCPRIPNLVRIGCALPDLFRKDRFFGPRSNYNIGFQPTTNIGYKINWIELNGITCDQRRVARGCGPHRPALASGGKRAKNCKKNTHANSLHSHFNKKARQSYYMPRRVAENLRNYTVEYRAFVKSY